MVTMYVKYQLCEISNRGAVGGTGEVSAPFQDGEGAAGTRLTGDPGQLAGKSESGSNTESISLAE
jgi:hypothetical protein